MIKPAVLDAMVAAGCTAQQIAAAVKADQSGSTNAERQARFRARRKALLVTENNVTDVTVTDTSPALDKENTPTPLKEIKPTPLPPVVVRARDFDTFWALFPNKVGKRKAEAAFVAALRRSSFDEIITGARRYAAKTDDRPWCNPTTFLNQDRWEDQPAEVVPQHRSHSPPTVRSMNDALDDLVNGKSHDEHPGPTIDASFTRADFGGTQSVVQFDAFAARQRP